jgi:hypothetical protein
MQLYESFIYRSTYLGNLFVVIGNAELNNKMASHMSDQKVFIIISTPLVILVFL